MNKVIQIFLALIAWFAVITQYFLMIENRLAPVGETTIRFFSFFTILTNTLVAIYFTVLFFNLKNRAFSFLFKPAALTAITVYIVVVGLVYNLVLRYIWQPQGMQKIVDELLHTIIPSLVLVYWFFDKRKSEVTFRTLPVWLVYPLCYLIFVLIRGFFSGFYPYPFIDVNLLGFNKVLLNAIGLFCGFIVISLIFVAVARATSKIMS